MKPSTSH